MQPYITTKMDPTKLLLLGLPIYLFCSDIVYLFTETPPPPEPKKQHQPNVLYNQKSQPLLLQHHLGFPTQKTSSIGGNLNIGVGNTVNINFCSSCSYRKNAATMKNMLQTAFPGIDVILANHPPSLTKRLLSKVIPVLHVGMIGIIVGGELIFAKLGMMTPPTWYYSLQANRFGSVATTWLLGNFIHSSLQSSGAFEVYCNDELVFSKLTEQRFPSDIELRDLVSKKISSFGAASGVGGEGFWS